MASLGNAPKNIDLLDGCTEGAIQWALLQSNASHGFNEVNIMVRKNTTYATYFLMLATF